MRTFIIIIITILTIFIIGDLLIWLMAYSSGHQLPTETTNMFLLTFIVLSIPTIFLYILLKRMPRQ
jgi:hypothetical protein